MCHIWKMRYHSQLLKSPSLSAKIHLYLVVKNYVNTGKAINEIFYFLTRQSELSFLNPTDPPATPNECTAIAMFLSFLTLASIFLVPPGASRNNNNPASNLVLALLPQILYFVLHWSWVYSEQLYKRDGGWIVGELPQVFVVDCSRFKWSKGLRNAEDVDYVKETNYVRTKETATSNSKK